MKKVNEVAAQLAGAARSWARWLVDLGRYKKRAILIVTDVVTLGLALWLAFSLRLGELYVAPTWQLFFIFCAAPLIGAATLFQLGLYRLVTRYISSQGALLIPLAIALSTLLWAFLVLLSGVQVSDAPSPSVQVVPRSVIILYPVLGAAFVWGTRRTAGWLLQRAGVEIPLATRAKARNVLIYGAGSPGVQLLDALRNSRSYLPV